MTSPPSDLYKVVIESQTERAEALSDFLADARGRLERALVARFGVDDGLDAAAEATAYAVAHWDRLPATKPTPGPTRHPPRRRT